MSLFAALLACGVACSLLTNLDDLRGDACAKCLVDAAGDVEAGDPHNCGAPGHDCLGGDCLNDQCQPIEIATGENNPASLFVDDGGVYWTNGGTSEAGPPHSDGAIRFANKDGTGLTTLLAGSASLQYLDGITADDQNLYVAANVSNAVFSLSRADGGTAQLVASNQPYVGTIVVDAVASELYWLNTYAQHVFVSTSTIGPPNAVVLASDTGVSGFLTLSAADGYWLNSSNNVVRSAPRAGCPNTSDAATCPSTVLTGDAGFNAVAVNDNTLYYAIGDTMEIWKMDLGTMIKTRLATSVVAAHAMMIDGTSLYVATSPPLETLGTVLRIDIGGAGAEVIAANQKYPDALAEDATAIYWVNRGTLTYPSFDDHDGSIMRLAK